MQEILKIHKYIPQFGMVLEKFLQSNYPEAEIQKGRRGNTLIMKRSARERLMIRFESDSQQQNTILHFSSYKWVVRGIRYGMLGVWPTPIVISGAGGFEENLAENLGRYLGMRFWAKAELLKPKGIPPDTYFCIGLFLLGCLFFAIYSCFDFVYSDSIWWFSGWCKRNGLMALLYSLVIWILFFYLWNRKKRLPLLSYLILTVSCMTGWTSLSTAYNVGRLGGSSYLVGLLYFIALLVPFVMGGFIYKSQKHIEAVFISRPLYNP